MNVKLPENLSGKSITISEGQKLTKDKSVAWKWIFTISDNGGDFDNCIIKYHELIYDIDKSISVLGETENEKWIEIKRSDCKDVPHIYSPLEWFVPQLNSFKEKELDILETFKEYLKTYSIKFEEGDWQSFDK